MAINDAQETTGNVKTVAVRVFTARANR